MRKKLKEVRGRKAKEKRSRRKENKREEVNYVKRRRGKLKRKLEVEVGRSKRL